MTGEKYIAKIVNVFADESILGEYGDLSLEKFFLIIFDTEHKAYYRLGERLGTVFSDGKRGVSILPKSVHTDRIKQNFDIWGFELTKEETEIISAKDLGHSEIVDHNDANLINYILNFAL